MKNIKLLLIGLAAAFALTGQGVTDEFVLSHEEQTGRRR